jgi:Zn-dependent protease with chaperone function
MLRHRIPALAISIVALAGTCAAQRPAKLPTPGFNLFTKQQDIQLGQEAAQKVRQQYPVVQNQFLQNYINQIGRRLANTPTARQSGFPFTFTLLNQNEVNAFALPGGPMFVFTGLIKDTDSEAELAGAMAHEMSHVILRHGTNQASKANLLQIPAMIAGVATGGSLLGQLAQAGIGLGVNSVLLKFSRTDETQADTMGARIMAEAGYNPIEMANFFEKLNAQGGSRGPQFLSDHPNPGNRVKAVQNQIRSFPQARYDYSTGEYQRAKQLVASLPPAPKATLRGAATPPSADSAPSGWQELRSQAFSLAYPSNWQAYGDSSSSAVTIAPKQGLVQTSSGSAGIGYGAILSYFFPSSSAIGLENGTEDLIHHLRSQNPSMQVSSQPRRVQVDGSQGLITMLESASPYGGAETDALLTVARPEGIFYMVFVAPSDRFRNAQGTFNRIIQSLRFTS